METVALFDIKVYIAVMHYYSVNYKISPSTGNTAVEIDNGSSYELIYLFSHPDILNKGLIKAVLEAYLKENKIEYEELTITASKEITGNEYVESTQYR